MLLAIKFAFLSSAMSFPLCPTLDHLKIKVEMKLGTLSFSSHNLARYCILNCAEWDRIVKRYLAKNL